MDSLTKYRSDYEHHPPRQVFYQRVRPGFSHERFVVPWQMEDSEKKREKDKEW